MSISETRIKQIIMCKESEEALKRLGKTTKIIQWIGGIIIVLFMGQLTVFGALRETVRHDREVLMNINDDYVPLWFLEGMYQNVNYQTEEIVATLNGDTESIKEINDKYIQFQKTMLNNLIQYRGGTTISSRGIEISKRQ